MLAAFLILAGGITLATVMLADADVVERRLESGAPVYGVTRWFAEMGEIARDDPLAWYLPRVLCLVAVVGFLLVLGSRLEDADRRRPSHG
jgi:hypothetical protein